ncbi:MAG: glycogen/starch synthase [Desulfobacterales bacterium]
MNQTVSLRVLMVTPEIACPTDNMVEGSPSIYARSSSLADICGSLISSLLEKNVDVHVVTPHYRRVFNRRECCVYSGDRMPGTWSERINLAQDRLFYYMKDIYPDNNHDLVKMSIAFQREVIHRFIPMVQPDVIHCFDAATGLIPGIARANDIPCLFSIRNLYNIKTTLSCIENMGIDCLPFWQTLYYEWMPTDFSQTCDTNPVDFLASGVFAADYVDTTDENFLKKLIQNRNGGACEAWQRELIQKFYAGFATGIENVPDPSFNPLTDPALFSPFGSRDHYRKKPYNKLFLQESFNLRMDSAAPMVISFADCDVVHPENSILLRVLMRILQRFENERLQFVFLGNHKFRHSVQKILHDHQLSDRVAIRPCDRRLVRIALGGADFMLDTGFMRTCESASVIGMRYGVLPITFASIDADQPVIPLNPNQNTGNGFLFNPFHEDGIVQSMQDAVFFYLMPQSTKSEQIQRIMDQSASDFSKTLQAYRRIYELLLKKSSENRRSGSISLSQVRRTKSTGRRQKEGGGDARPFSVSQ